VAAKEELQIAVEDDTARVRAASASPELQAMVLVKQRGGWKIDLRQSVPPKIRQSLYEVYRTRCIGAPAEPSGKLASIRSQRIMNGVTSTGSPGVAAFRASRIIRSSRACGDSELGLRRRSGAPR
jgi:hypothetical protein